MIELTLYNVIKNFDSNLVLNNIGFQIFDKEKVGIVGANGSGKSTILKLIAGIEPMDRDNRDPREGKGWITMTKGAAVAYLDQLPSYPDGFKVSGILNLAFQELYAIEDQLRVLESSMMKLEGVNLERALKQYSELQQNYEVKGGYDKEEKLSRVCKGLKFNEAFIDKDFNILSGGEKTTVILGKILLESPDILLLDEPTNHLDMESIEWLEGYLRSYKGIVIIVSHDRYFLDNVVTKIIELEDMECETYKGNYSDYFKQKEERMLLQFEDFKEQQKKMNSMEKAIKDLRDWAQRGGNTKFIKRAVSIQKRLDKMEQIDKPVFERRNIKLNFVTSERSGNDVIMVLGLQKSFEDKAIFKDANLSINKGERVAMIGSNGSGKTTFIKMLLGETTVDGGSVKVGSNVKTAYLPQNISFNNEELTVVDCFRENRNILEGKAREYLSKFMFLGKSVFEKVKHLSGGEKVRLKLSMLLYDDINLLILDEPTNHLDIDSIETLEEALEDFKGTILFISHDRRFINKVCDRVISIEENVFVNYLGNYDYYKNKKSELYLALAQQPAIKRERSQRETFVIEDQKREIKRNLAKLESTIKSLEDEVREIDKAMAALVANHDELNKLYHRKEEINKELDKMIEMWANYGSNDTSDNADLE